MSEHVCDPSDLTKMITVKSGLDCRSVILGHVQRGGSPTAFDRNLGSNFGAKAVERIWQGECGAVGRKGGKYIFVPIDDAFKQTRKFDMDQFILAQRLSF